MALLYFASCQSKGGISSSSLLYADFDASEAGLARRFGAKANFFGLVLLLSPLVPVHVT